VAGLGRCRQHTRELLTRGRLGRAEKITPLTGGDRYPLDRELPAANKMSWDKERSGFCWRLPFRGFKKLANGRLSRAARVSVIRPTGHSIDWESGMPGSTGTAGSLGVSCGYSKPRELPPDGGR
jgi:hypothetical protein